jgi:hypothetical protein
VKTFQFALFAASLLTLSACAGKPAEKPDKVIPAPTDMSVDDLDIAIDNGVKLQNEKGEEMVCRKEAKTGSRLARETVCMTKAEWLAVAEESQRATRRSMRGGNIPHGSD